MVKNPPSNAGDARNTVSAAGSGRSRAEGDGHPFQYSFLENCMDRGAWQVTVHGVTESDTTELSTYVYMRERQTITAHIRTYKLSDCVHVIHIHVQLVCVCTYKHLYAYVQCICQFRSVAQSCSNSLQPHGPQHTRLPFRHLPELAQTHVHRVRDVIQPSHLLSSLSPPAFNLSQHQSLFQ